jgi:hypothetical protein
MLPKLALIQGAFYLATGLWPIVDSHSFQLVTGTGSALGLAIIDLVYSLSGRISAVYLGDAVIEIGLAALWMFGRRRA